MSAEGCDNEDLRGLTPLQQKFVVIHATEPCGAESARQAGYKGVHRSVAARLMAKPKIRAAVERRRKAHLEKFDLRRGQLLRELAAVVFQPGYWDYVRMESKRVVVGWTGPKGEREPIFEERLIPTLIPVQELTEQHRRALETVEWKVLPGSILIPIPRFHSKVAALKTALEEHRRANGGNDVLESLIDALMGHKPNFEPPAPPDEGTT